MPADLPQARVVHAAGRWWWRCCTTVAWARTEPWASATLAIHLIGHWRMP